MPRPILSEVPEFYHKYIEQVKANDLIDALQQNTGTVVPFLKSIPDGKWNYRYAEGKWSLKEMLQHIIDAERIFSYRALCFARGEQASLPGFDENSYAALSKADRQTAEELILEFETLRKSIEQLFMSFDAEQLAAKGIANNKAISVNAIGFIIPGHVQHHVNIINERYL